LSEPLMVVVPPVLEADEIAGKFWRLFAPVSPSPASLAVTPAVPRSIPSLVFEKIAFPRTAFPVPDWTKAPAPPLNATTLPAAAARRVPAVERAGRVRADVVPGHDDAGAARRVDPAAAVAADQVPFQVVGHAVAVGADAGVGRVGGHVDAALAVGKRGRAGRV